MERESYSSIPCPCLCWHLIPLLRQDENLGHVEEKSDFVKRMKLGLKRAMCDVGDSGEKTDDKWGAVSQRGRASPDPALPSRRRPGGCPSPKACTA